MSLHFNRFNITIVVRTFDNWCSKKRGKRYCWYLGANEKKKKPETKKKGEKSNENSALTKRTIQSIIPAKSNILSQSS